MKKLLLTIMFCSFLVSDFLAANGLDSGGANITGITQQTRKLQGVVLDVQGEPVIGASVKLKANATVGTITDIDGKFSLAGVTAKDVVVISFIGYVTQEIKVSNNTSVNVVMKEDSEMLSEVVITAFGAGQKKESVVGSIQTVRPTDLKVPSSNLSTSFAGRMAGVVSFQRSGVPGDNGADFYVRGISTISGMTSPLIVIDGVEASSADLNALSPEVIEGFSILKDATATAMYGTRGANGVMIVTTKSGADVEKPIIGILVEANVNMPTKVPKFVSGDRYMQLYNEAVGNQGTGDVMFTNEQIMGVRNGTNPYVFPNVDWYDEIFKNSSFNQRVNFNIRGGTKKITYFMNVNVNHETGMLKNRSKDFFTFSNNIDVLRYAFQNNIDFKISKDTKIGLHLNVQLNDITSPVTGDKQENVTDIMNAIYGSIMDSNPVDFPAYFPNTGEKWVKWGAYSGGNDQAATNPLAQATRGYSDTFASTVLANLDFEQKLNFLTDGLTFKAMVSFKNYNRTITNRMQGVNRYSVTNYSQNEDGAYDFIAAPLGEPSKPILGTNRLLKGDRRIYIQAYLDYNRTFAEKHSVNAMALFNTDEYVDNTGGGLIQSLPKRKLGMAFRTSYGYDNRYMVEFNAGYNGSENFAKGHRFGFFPSAAIGYNISREKFWEPLSKVVSNLKLRASYGLVGNDQINDQRFIYMADVSLKGNDDSPSFTTGYGNSSTTLKGPIYNRMANDAITWEVGEKLNVGADIQLFNALDISIDGFREIRRDIFQEMYSIPNYLGTAKTKLFGNLAKVKNWGFDASVSYGKQINKNLSVQFKGTFTFARNKVLEYNEAPGISPAYSIVGNSVKSFLLYVANGLYIDGADIANNPTSTLGNIAIAPGDIKYVDQPNGNGEYDGKISDNDRIRMGHPSIPEIVYGFGPSINYKNWDFSFFFQGVGNTSLVMSGFHPFGTQVNRNVLEFITDNYWSQSNQNPDAAYPRLTKYDNNNNTVGSSYWLRDASFLKLKNAEIGYSLKNFRVYLSGTNLLTFSKFKLWDPEMGGDKAMKYPTQRTFNIGIQLSFK